jgi:hypothetical protein
LEAVTCFNPLLISPAIDVVQYVGADRALSWCGPSPEESREDWDLEITLVYLCLKDTAWVERRHAAGFVWYCVVQPAIEKVVHAILLHQLLV